MVEMKRPERIAQMGEVSHVRCNPKSEEEKKSLDKEFKF